MQPEITYEWTLDFMKKVTRKFVIRYAGASLFGLFIIFLIGAAALIYGQAESIVWMAVIVPLILFGMWSRYYFQAVNSCLQLTDRKVTLRIEPETLSFFMADRSSTIKWSVIKKIWVFPDAILLFIHGEQTFSAIPTAPLDEETKQFILTKVKEHGGKVE